jgi:hydrogenase maturation protease
MKTLIIGLGNPILGDDGVGWKVAEQLTAAIKAGSSVEVDCVTLGGLSLMERMLGYQRVILIDSMETGQCPEGTVKLFPLFSLPNPMAGHSASIHDTSLINALQTAQALGADVPERVDVVAIEAKKVYDFSDDLSPAISSAVPLASQKVLKLLRDEVV